MSATSAASMPGSSRSDLGAKPGTATKAMCLLNQAHRDREYIANRCQEEQGGWSSITLRKLPCQYRRHPRCRTWAFAVTSLPLVGPQL